LSNIIFKHLEPFSSDEGYWYSTDCIAVAEDILQTTKAVNMLEIGFNIGYSASIWLSSGIEKLYVIDINRHKDTEAALLATKNFYSDKLVQWWLLDSTSELAKNIKFTDIDIAFIDGAHDYDAVISDIELCLATKCKWLVFDDVHYEGVNTVYPAIKHFIDKNAIVVEKEYDMTWYQVGKVLLCKVQQ